MMSNREQTELRTCRRKARLPQWPPLPGHRPRRFVFITP